MKNKRGSGYVSVVLGVWAFLTVFAFVLVWAKLTADVRLSRENTQRALDSFVVRNSVILYDNVKRGNADTDGWDEELWELLSTKELRVVKQGRVYAAYDTDGREKWIMTVPELSFVSGDTLCLRAEYVFREDLSFGGVRLGSIDVPVTVDSLFLQKDG